jgi:hypothetical protein
MEYTSGIMFISLICVLLDMRSYRHIHQVLERFLEMKTTLSAEASAVLAEILALSPAEIRYVLARAEELGSK